MNDAERMEVGKPAEDLPPTGQYLEAIDELVLLTPSATFPITFSLTRPRSFLILSLIASRLPPSPSSMTTLTSPELGLMYAPQNLMILGWSVLLIWFNSLTSCLAGVDRDDIIFLASSRPVLVSRTLYTSPPAPSPSLTTSSRFLSASSHSSCVACCVVVDEADEPVCASGCCEDSVIELKAPLEPGFGTWALEVFGVYCPVAQSFVVAPVTPPPVPVLPDDEEEAPGTLAFAG